jgi:hypothetical protein
VAGLMLTIVNAFLWKPPLVVGRPYMFTGQQIVMLGCWLHVLTHPCARAALDRPWQCVLSCGPGGTNQLAAWLHIGSNFSELAKITPTKLTAPFSHTHWNITINQIWYTQCMYLSYNAIQFNLFRWECMQWWLISVLFEVCASPAVHTPFRWLAAWLSYHSCVSSELIGTSWSAAKNTHCHGVSIGSNCTETIPVQHWI